MVFNFIRFSLIIFISLVAVEIQSQGYQWSFNQPTLSGLFWVRNYEMKDGGFSDETTEEEIAIMITNQASSWFSAMINGYAFSFEPMSYRNGVQQKFEIKPLGKIETSRLSFELLNQTNEKTEYLYRYKCNKTEQRKRAIWQSTKFKSSSGRGESSIFNGYSAREEAVNNAIKSGLINYFKEKLINKPRQIKGTLIFIETPRIFFNKGHLFADVNILIEEREVQDYLY